MALHAPAPLESAWQSVLARALGRPVDPRALGIMVERLARREDGDDVSALAHTDELAARALYGFPRDIRKIELPAVELFLAGALPRRPLRVLDAGAGLGAHSLGLLRALQPRGVELAQIAAIDADAQALALMQGIAREASRVGLLPGLPGVIAHLGDPCDVDAIAEASKGGVDLILFDAALVERSDDESTQGLSLAAAVASIASAAKIADDGAVIVMSTGLQWETRALHHARAELIARGFGIFAPCTHQGACPMLASADDWCHEDLDAHLPEWLVPIALDASLPREGLVFSYLVVRRDASRSVGDLARRDGFIPARLISQPRVTKGKTEAFASGAGRGLPLMELARTVKRDGGAHASLATYARGDVIALAKDVIETSAEDSLIRVEPRSIAPATVPPDRSR